MSSTGSIAEHPVVTGLRTAAGALDPVALGLGWQLRDDDVETAIATVQDLRSRTAAVEVMLLREAEPGPQVADERVDDGAMAG